jgi:hypothetical protein
MLSDVEREALRRWYSQDAVLARAKMLYEADKLEELEEWLHGSSLFPLGRHDALPDYMKAEDGSPLFPTNLNPRADEKVWQDAIEIGWAIVEEKLGISHDEIHRRVAQEQTDDWDAFMESVEERKRKRS